MINSYRKAMKVGILTFHSSYNFGANLQTLAVQEILKRRGCCPVIIDYRNPWKTEMYRSIVSPTQAETHERFIEKYLNTSPRFCCEKEVQEYCNDELDIIIVGSDQVFRLLSRWAPRSLFRLLLTGNPSSPWMKMDNHLPVYYLPWPKNDSARPARIAIAACALGTSYFFLGKTLWKEARQSLRNFDFVSVRDNWTRIVVTWLSGGKVRPELCPDPVFGLNDCFIVPQEEVPDIDVSRTILISGALDKKWLSRFSGVAHDHGFRISNLPDTDRVFAFDESDFTIDLPLSPLAWYSLLSRAAGYIGARYHGLVSCVANQTPVVSLDLSRKPRLLKVTSRTYDLCSKASATDRYVPVNWLSCPGPAAVLKRLMDESSQTAMNHYAKKAKRRLWQVVDEIITRVSLEGGRYVPQGCV